MTAQSICQVFIVLGVVISTFATYGSFHFGKAQAAATAKESESIQNRLHDQIEELKQNVSAQAEHTKLIGEFLNVKPDQWQSVELKNIPPGVADYAMLLFQTSEGRISGKTRMKGSQLTTMFSTTPNSKTPVAVGNHWDIKSGQYASPAILEFAVTEQTAPNATLKILTAGWIDTRGREPHLPTQQPRTE